LTAEGDNADGAAHGTGMGPFFALATFLGVGSGRRISLAARKRRLDKLRGG
jgi:hypothetical protein